MRDEESALRATSISFVEYDNDTKWRMGDGTIVVILDTRRAYDAQVLLMLATMHVYRPEEVNYDPSQFRHNKTSINKNQTLNTCSS